MGNFKYLKKPLWVTMKAHSADNQGAGTNWAGSPDEGKLKSRLVFMASNEAKFQAITQATG